MHPMLRRLVATSLSVAIAIAPVGPALAAPAQAAAAPTETPWPLRIQSNDTTLTLYPLQIDSWDGSSLKGRSAVQASVGTDKPQVAYGVIDLSARTLVDKGQRLVTLDKVDIVKSDFPAVPKDDASRFTALIAHDLGRRSRTVALERLEASLAVADKAEASQKLPLRNVPPQILFSDKPGLLVTLDGSPAFRPVEGTALQRVINTRPMLVKDEQGQFFLRVFDGWMSAAQLEGPWKVGRRTGELDRAFKALSESKVIDPLSGQSTPDQPAPKLKDKAPVIFTATVPTELIVFDGAPQYVPIKDTQLLYVANTTGHVFKLSTTGETFVLLAGRWFKAASDKGPWTFVAANKLPGDFGAIPDDSAKENVKASVAATPQAREATIAATVPQTAIVKISGTQLTKPFFDGDPVLRPIVGTPLQYVFNSGTPIIQVAGNQFYSLEKGVWFTAQSVHGPWAVATSVPPVIYTIPPSSPLHYVTYARIYLVDGDTVYVGYTAGYQGTMIDPETGVVVYGTGYDYDPWIGTVWFGAPCTYGYGAAMAYTPWTGWAVAFGFGWYWASTVYWGWGWGPYPWWGPWYGWGWYGGIAYGPGGGAIAWGPGGWAGYSGNIYQQWGNRATVSRVTAGFNAWTGNAWAGRAGISYNSRTGIAAAGQRGAVGNVYTGNYASGARGVATGPGGNVIGGSHVDIGNVNTGNEISGTRGAYYNQSTGEVTKFGGIHGEQGTIGHVGDDVYAGHDGSVYRNTGSGWEKFTPGSGWAPASAGQGEGAATRAATGGLGATHPAGGPQQADLARQREARMQGAQRSEAMQRSSMHMQRQMPASRGGGGFRGRR